MRHKPNSELTSCRDVCMKVQLQRTLTGRATALLARSSAVSHAIAQSTSQKRARNSARGLESTAQELPAYASTCMRYVTLRAPKGAEPNGIAYRREGHLQRRYCVPDAPNQLSVATRPRRKLIFTNCVVHAAFFIFVDTAPDCHHHSQRC